MLRTLFSFALFVLLAASGPAKADTLDIIAMIDSSPRAYWKTMRDGLKAASGFYGLETIVYSASDADNQRKQCDFALLKGPRALIFAAIDLEKLAPCLKRASAKKIPLIDITGTVEEARATNLGFRIAFSVAANQYEIGKMAALQLTGKKGKVLVMQGDAADLTFTARSKGFRDNLPAGLHIVATEPANDNRFLAAATLNRVMVPHPDLTYVFATSDIMGLGAVDALTTNYNTRVKVISADGIADAVQSIKKGGLEASVAVLPYLIAKYAIEKTQRLLGERTVYEYKQYVPSLTLNKAVLDAKVDPLLEYLK